MFALRTILHPTDFSEPAECAFQLAWSLAHDHAARLILLHVWLPPPAPLFGPAVPLPTQPDGYFPSVLEERMERLHGPNDAVRVEHRFEEGSPVEGILQVADETACDLIIMGTHGRRGFGRLLKGSVAENVMRRAPCPVMTVKGPWVATMPRRRMEFAAAVSAVG